MATFSLDQPYPVPGLVRVKFTADDSGNWVRVWLTDAPNGSELRAALDAASTRGAAPRIEVFVGAMSDTWERDFDVGGKYTFQIQEYTYGASTHGGGFKDDPSAFPTESKVGAEDTQYIHIGQRVTCRLGASPYGTATLVLWVWDTAVRATTVDAHGEESPRIVQASTDAAVTAALDTTLQTQLAALVGKTSSQLLGNLDTLCQELKTDLPLHFNNDGTGYHESPDTYNDTEIEDLPEAPETPAGYVKCAQVLLSRLRLHMENVNAAWHVNGSANDPDWGNYPIAALPAGNDMGAALAALADVVRAYEAHRQETAHHPGGADATHTITTALGELVKLHRDFLDALRKQSPTAPTTQNSLYTALVHGAGVQLVPPGIIPPGIIPPGIRTG